MLLQDCTIVGITPFEHPDCDLLVAICRSGALGVLDLGRDLMAAERSLTEAARQLASTTFGIRVPDELDFDPARAPSTVDVVVLPSVARLPRWRSKRVLVQVRSIDEAQDAVRAGADGLIAKGAESGGLIGDDSSFILLQRLAGRFDLPIFAQGGVGLHTAAACVAAGATGVVLDSQLALVAESALPDAIKSVVLAMDGSETAVVGRHRVFTRPDLPVAAIGDPEPSEMARRVGVADLQRFFLGAGQDAAFAPALARRFRTAGGVVRAIRHAATDHLRLAKRLRPLAKGAPLASAHGIEFPIAQGPMTRVSDRAGFANAVSQGGGLPFLALSLMRGDEARSLMRETAALLGDRTWGVGVLGFVPQELRDEQLRAIEDVRPSVALIAGGRPAQARSLEARGIPTYLHVPSPGLLDLFLKDGARRFVFEGRECGGHVGPRTSFVLWESQIERLLHFDRPEELSILFAGGIHDARSAAMVAALAAPLAARRARVGVLMGTAYLFTEEAVATGAIQKTFQDAAIACDRTVLLETAPGHSTRCADSEYARVFAEEKRRLEAQGLGSQEVWSALERLNLGRLRIASKGLRRDGAQLVDVGADDQRRDGMFMIGEAASLRAATTTIRSLHEQVSEGATAHLAGIVDPTRPASRPPGDEAADIAIVGIECIFPAAPDRHAFWSHIVRGADLVTEVPRERWNPDIYFEPGSIASGKTNSKWGAFIPAVAFDPVAHGIPPRSVSAIEPVQLLSLEVAKRALADAGYADRDFDRERTSVIFGVEPGTDLANAYAFRALYPQLAGALPQALDDALPVPTEDSFPGVLGNVVAGRIANRLDLGGVNYTVDAACASSLAAIDLALKELRTGESDMVLCGGADLHNSINDYLMFSAVHALSPTGRCRAFDIKADGLALGEGIAVVVLKRLKDAEHDGDRIYAVIRGLGASSDGRCLSLTAPRKEGQERALDRAYRRAGVSPADVGLMEAHGTGTVVGDSTELASLTAVFEAAGATPGGCALGSVKSQIGHTKCAAGMAGLIKVALSLYHGVLPPTLHVSEPNPFYDAASSPFGFSSAARPWPAARRHGAVSAFGFGGTNFHAVLSRHEGPEAAEATFAEWPAELFLFRGNSPADAIGAVERVDRALSRQHPWRFRDIARTVSTSSGARVQIAIVASDIVDLRAKLRQAVAGAMPSPGVFTAGGSGGGAVAFLYPGQGSQRPGMLSDLFVAFPQLRRLLTLGERWHSRMFPAEVFTAAALEQAKQRIDDPRVAQPALGLAGLAMSQLLADCGVRPDMVAGHSYGELVALCIAGAIEPAELLALSEARGQCMLDAAGSDPGTMAAVSGRAADVERAIAGLAAVVVANYNAPQQTVISGSTAGVAEAVVRLQRAGLSARKLAVACAFHSTLVAGAEPAFAACLADVTVASPAIPVWSNLDAATYPAEPGRVRARMAKHLAQPVQFVRQIESMYEAGARIFVEAGPGNVLGTLVGRILGDRPHVALSCDRPGEPALEQFQRALAALAVHGVAIETSALFEGRDAKIVDFDAPQQRLASTMWMVNGQAAWPAAGEPPTSFVKTASSALVPTAASPRDRDQVALEYLNTMRTLVEAQRDVMLQYFGQSAPAQAVAPPYSEPVAEAVREPLSSPAPERTTEAPAGQSVLEALRAIVSERTGYPPDMLDPDLDLEADLGIDSIKRIEILGELGDRLHLGIDATDRRDQIMEELTVQKTLRAIVEWLEANRPEVAPRRPAASSFAPLRQPEQEEVGRYVLSLASTSGATAGSTSVAGRSFILANDGGGIATRVAERLRADGASVNIVEACDLLANLSDGLDAVVYLTSLAAPQAVHPAKDLFELARHPSMEHISRVVAATGMGGDFGRHRNGARPDNLGGVAGFLKSVAKERKGLSVRVIDLDLSESPDLLAAHIRAELSIDTGPLEVGYLRGSRVTPAVVAMPHVRSGPGARIHLDASSVILLIGGAKGITARVAVALARRYRCRLELIGRSPEPDANEFEVVGATRDPLALRQALIARTPNAAPAAIEAEWSRLRGSEELRSTIAAIAEAGGTAHYTPVDVRDAAAFEAFLDGLYRRHDRLDAVIYGAGIVEDKLLRHKTRESFDRVFDTKVSGALTLARKLRKDVGAVVFFSSIAGAFGSRGQADYAAANDVLDKLAWALHERVDGRVVSINWGPWAESGMVSPELQREYGRRGIGLIAPERGVEALIDELSYGVATDVQVILSNADPAIL